ncbi:hypothetical protein [Nisaea sp.]|uniref:hypothetical protein n=1 Tax=Nisaea sp. TaxID=2024842 RepID=UPI00329A665C
MSAPPVQAPCRTQAVEGMAHVFAKGGSNDDRETEVKELHAKIGRLALENGTAAFAAPLRPRSALA